MKRLLLFLLLAPTIVQAQPYLPVFDVNSYIIRVKIEDTSKTSTDEEIGLAGLAYNTANLAIHHICDVESTVVTYTGANIQDITTLGTYAAPSASSIRFKAVDGTNLPGIYEIQIADARHSVANSRSCILKWDTSGGTITNFRAGELAYSLLADAAGAVGGRQVPQLGANPGVADTITYDTMLRALYQRFFHKFTDNGVEQAGFKADGSTKAFENNVSDSGGTYTKDANKVPD